MDTHWKRDLNTLRAIFKSSQFTGGDLVFFVPVPMLLLVPPVATDFCSSDNFRATFHISFIFGRIDGPDL